MTVKKRTVDIDKFKDRAILVRIYCVFDNFPVFAGLSAAFMVLYGIVCAYEGGAHNGTDYGKRIYCGKANEKTETVFPGTNPEVQSPFVLQAKG